MKDDDGYRIAVIIAYLFVAIIFFTFAFLLNLAVHNFFASAIIMAFLFYCGFSLIRLFP